MPQNPTGKNLNSRCLPSFFTRPSKNKIQPLSTGHVSKTDSPTGSRHSVTSNASRYSVNEESTAKGRSQKEVKPGWLARLFPVSRTSIQDVEHIDNEVFRESEEVQKPKAAFVGVDVAADSTSSFSPR